MLPEPLKLRAVRCASKRGISFGQLLRQALQAEVDRASHPAEDPLLADDTVFVGAAPADTALHHDRYLYGTEE